MNQQQSRNKATRVTESWQERGQAMVEAAITIVFLLMLLGAIIDFGRAFVVYIALHNAVAEGAYYASAFPLRNEDLASNAHLAPDTIQYRTQHEVPSNLQQWVDWDAADIEVSYMNYDVNTNTHVPMPNPAFIGPQDLVDVSIEYPLAFIGPIPGLFGLDGIPLRVTATQTVLTNIDNPPESP